MHEGHHHDHDHDSHGHRYAGEIERLRRPERLAWLEIDRVAARVLADGAPRSLLDVGTGSGIWAEAFARHGLKVAGVDVSPKMIVAAGDFVPHETDLRVAPAEHLPFADGAFDAAFLGHLLHETDDPVQALREARRVARRVWALEWPHRAETDGPPLDHRLTTAQVEAFARDAGFAGVETETLERMVLFRFATAER